MKNFKAAALWVAVTVAGVAASGITAATANPLYRPVVYVSDRGAHKIVVFPGNTPNPLPIAQITTGIVEPEGIAVDARGDLFVANGSAANVLEFAPGASRPMRTFTTGLHHPVNVALDSAGDLYVADQSPAAIVEFPTMGRAPVAFEMPYPALGARGIAIDPSGDVFISISGINDLSFPGVGICQAISDVYEIPAGGVKMVPLFLSANEQAFGLALDANGTLYASDPCFNHVGMYVRNAKGAFGFAGLLQPAGAMVAPYYMTLRGGVVSVPNAGIPGKPGFVTVTNPLAKTPPYTISATLVAPISAAQGTIAVPPPLR